MNDEIQREQEDKNGETNDDKVEEKTVGKAAKQISHPQQTDTEKAEVLQEEMIKRRSPLRLYVEANKTARPIH